MGVSLFSVLVAPRGGKQLCVQRSRQGPVGLQLSSSPWGFLCTPGSFPCGSAQFWPAVPAAAQTPVCGQCLPAFPFPDQQGTL